MLGELVERRHAPAAVQVAPQAVELAQQLHAVFQAAGGKALGQFQLQRVSGAQAGQLGLHARLQLPFKQVREIGPEWRAGRTEKTGPRAVADERPPLHQVHEARRGVLRPAQQLGDRAAQGRMTADRSELLRGEARLALKGVVLAIGSDQRAQEDEAVRVRRHLRHQLGQMHAGNLGGQGLELAANLAGRVGLRVNQVHLRRAAVEMQVDDRLARGADPGLGLLAQEFREG